MKKYAVTSLFVLAIGWGAAALGLALELRTHLTSDPAAVFAVTLAALLGAAFLRAAVRREDLRTLMLSEGGGEFRMRGRVLTWRWSEVTALILSGGRLLFELAFLTVEVPLNLFRDSAAISEYVANAVPEREGSGEEEARLVKRSWIRTYGPALVLAVFLFCGAVYMDFARRVLVDCGLRANGASAAGGLLVLGACIAKLWLEIPRYGAAILGCTAYFAVVAGIQRPLYLNAQLWRVTAFNVALLGVACGIAFWAVRRMERRARLIDQSHGGSDRQTA